MKFEYSYVHVISGEDFLAQPIETIEDFFDSENKIFCQCELCIKGKTRRARWYRYYWPYVKFRNNYKNPYVRLFNLFCIGLQVLCPFIRRKQLGEFSQVYGGLVWGSYPYDAVKYIIDYIKDNPEFMEELEWCKIPEELCFQTILCNSMLKDRVAYNNKRYGNFTDGDGSGPVYLKNKDIAIFDNQGSMFVRKIENGSEVMQKLKERQHIPCNF